MRVVAALAVVIALGALGVARADENAPLWAAEQELKIARDHLAEAGHEYGGHRAAALEAVNKALQEIHDAIDVAKAGGSPKREKPAAHEQDDD